MSGILTEFTSKRWMDRERSLAEKVGDLAMESSSVEVDSPQDLVVRNVLPAEDLDSGAANGWTDSTGTEDEEWTQDHSSSGSADSYNEAYVIDSSSLAEDKIIGFMGVSVLHPNLETREIRFNSGTAGSQGVKKRFNIEALETASESRAMFLTDTIFGAKEDGNIEMWDDVAQDGNRLVFHGYVAEAVGETLSEASNPKLASGGRGRAMGR